MSGAERPGAVSAVLPWQDEAWGQLGRQFQAGQLPHALLLAGPEHSGKSRLALALARLLLCARPINGLNCGQCHACELTASGNHGDFRWLEPEDRSRVIKIEQVRQLLEFTQRTAAFGQRKVAVLCPAESMTVNAANSLLKCLEEPTPETYLLLVCHRLQGLPPTIRSRCQMLRLALPARQPSLAWLDGTTGDRTESEQLLELADGRPLLAARLHDSEDRDRLFAVRLALQELLTGGHPRLAQLAALLAEDDLDRVLPQLATSLQRELRRLEPSRLATPQGRAAFGLLDEITATQRAVHGGANPNRQLLIESLLGKVQRKLGPDGSGGSIWKK